MNIVHLKYAVEVANTGSINKAAENLYMNQPNLSRAIKELEDSLCITIFERTTRGMVVTQDGEEFLRYARKILRQIDEVEAIYSKEKRDQQRFSVSVPRACYISAAFAQFVRGLDKDKPAEVFYQETNTMSAINNILHADYQLAIIRYASDCGKHFKRMLEEKGLTYEMITEFHYVLVMSRFHPLAQKEKIHLSDLHHFTKIAHADPLVPLLPVAAAKKEELPPETDKQIFVYERASQFELLSEDTDTFMWVSPIPRALLDRYGLVQKECEDYKKIYRDVLVYRRDYRLTQLDKEFITELCEAKRHYL